jgi:FkbM family methyltransferase
VISYAQNAEDVVLARLFAGQPAGRYVDIGAGDPVEASVTKHFYDHGWRGVNIEPIPAMAERLRRDRPADVTLAVAVGAKPGSAVLHVVADEWGWSTLDDQLARGYREDKDWRLDDVEVALVTLEAVLDDHPGRVDFLKIDVEGAEQDVIDGGDWTRHRPRVVVVEATEPGSPTPAHEKWEPVLLDAGYRCALFDGLNRFYAEAADDEALTVLAAPANVFDTFERYTRQQELDARAAGTGYIRRLEATLADAHAARAKDAEYVATLQSAIAEAQRQATRAGRHIAALESRIAELEADTADNARAPRHIDQDRNR